MEALIDLHAHLDYQKYQETRWEILQKFFATPQSQLITVADPFKIESIDITKEMLDKFPRLLFMIGAHPHNASDYGHETEARILNAIKLERMIAVGETGLDYHYQFSPRNDQVKVLKRQIAIAREAKLPLLLHSRKAERDILNILAEEAFPNPVIFHCYTGGSSEAREIVERGYYISFSGIITFKNSGILRDILIATPLKNIFLETDSPYLSPEPFRGQTNSPLFISYIYEKAAEILRIGVSQLQNTIISNFTFLFKTDP